MSVAAIVLGAGRGVRLGAEVPKAHVRVAGRTLLEWSARALARARGVAFVQPVIAANAEPVVAELRAGWDGPARLLPPVYGGERRQDSVLCGMEALERACPELEYVLVHDAARCLLLVEDAEAVLAAAQPTGAALLVTPLDDTLKELDGDRVIGTPDRSRLVRALTPQAYRVGILREALAKAAESGFVGTDCSSLVERLGIEVRSCPGSAENFKVTTPSDLERAERILSQRPEAR
jgi:2-C-methyl-D-erythritol 4-phosphate cytidylyltransferase